MRGPKHLKRDFLKKWVKGLKICSSSKKEMSLLERKKAIKLSADIAMAMASSATKSSWSVALIADAAKDDNSKNLVQQMLGHTPSKSSLIVVNKRVRSKKILKKSCCAVRRAKKMGPKMVLASCIAKRMVKKRTQVLKRLVPGGEEMDELSLIKETLDYIVSLRAQVDVMKSLVDVTDLLKFKEVVNN